MTEKGSPLARVRNPEHTGENRCLPCTVVNVAIAAGLAALAAVVALELAAVVAVVSVGAIGLRGYLVPGTPELTKRYLPERVLQAFGKDDPPTAPDDWDTLEKVRHHRQNAVDEDTFLAEEGIVTGSDEDRELTDDVVAALDERLAERETADDLRGPLADAFDSDADDIEIDRDEYPAVTVGNRIREWPSWSALRVDVAAHEALSAHSDRWSDVPLEQRVDMLETVRSLRTVCPACGGAVERASEVQTSCCGVHEVLAVGCVDCEARLAELNPKTHAGKLVS